MTIRPLLIIILLYSATATSRWSECFIITTTTLKDAIKAMRDFIENSYMFDKSDFLRLYTDLQLVFGKCLHVVPRILKMDDCAKQINNTLFYIDTVLKLDMEEMYDETANYLLNNSWTLVQLFNICINSFEEFF